MSFLFGSPKLAPPQFTGLQVQTSVNTMCIPVVYGLPRCQVNLIYTNGFRAQRQKAAGGGKGLLTGGKNGSNNFDYFSTIVMAIGEGELGAIQALYVDQQLYDINGIAGTLPVKLPRTLIYFDGAIGQPPWSWIQTNWPNDMLYYPYTAYIGFEDFPLDSSGTIPQFNVVVRGKYSGTCGSAVFQFSSNPQIWPDADPALCLYDILTNFVYGSLFPPQFIDQSTVFSGANSQNPSIGDAAYQTYVSAVGPLGFSTVMNSPERISSTLERWMKLTNSAIVWTGYSLKFIPYGDLPIGPGAYWDPVSGTPPCYYRPNMTPIFSLTDDDYLMPGDTEDPITIERTDISDSFNVVRLDYRNRGNAWNDDVVEVKDENAIELYGERPTQLSAANEYGNSAIAAIPAQLILQRNIAIRNQATFKLPIQYCILDPMDIIALNDATLGLVNTPYRIISIEEDDQHDLTFICEELLIGSGTAVAYPKQSSAGFVVQTNLAPGPVNPPALVQPSITFSNFFGFQQKTVTIGLSGGSGGVPNPNWGGAQVWVSNDNVTFTQLGAQIGATVMGTLTANLAAGAGNPDNINTLNVDISESGGTLNSVTVTQAANGSNLALIVYPNSQPEVISFTTVTLTSPGHYSCVGLYRGLLGSVNGAHLSGAQFMMLNGSLFQEVLPAAYSGTTIHLKFPSFNSFNSGTEDLASVTSYALTLF